MAAKYNAEKEFERLRGMLVFEAEARAAGHTLIAGIDEAGRGPLAGPVVSAAAILPEGFLLPGLNDSKLLSEKKREALYGPIVEGAISWAVGISDKDTIDGVNILNATKLSMKEAIGALRPQPDYLLIDAVRLDGVAIPQNPIIKGDALSLSIAAASVIAKVTRDRIMLEYDAAYPQYGFARHKGYGTRQHVEAIKKYGISPIHRITYLKKLGY
jgi:ribonuclease HII